MGINWYPGHMKKATDEIRQKLRQIDLCCEIRDARIPFASANRELAALTKGKKRIIVLNKKDMADPKETERWVQALRGNGQTALAINASKERPAKRLYEEAISLLQEKQEKRLARSIINREVRMLVYGIPNSGKSTFINALSKKRSAAVGDRPGFTKQQQWIKTDADLLLVDTPGILPKKLGETQALHLAFTGAIRDDILPLQDVGYALLTLLLRCAPEAIVSRYALSDASAEPLAVMEAIAQHTGSLLKGGEVDYTRTAQIMIDDFRKLHFGALTLERAADFAEREWNKGEII